MALKEGKVRININVTKELKEWFDTQAESFGCSTTSLIVIAMAQYKQQQEGLTMMKDMGKFSELLSELQKQVQGKA